MRQALFFLIAMTTFARAIMLPDDPNRLPSSWKRSIDRRDGEPVTEVDDSEVIAPSDSNDVELGDDQERSQTVWNPCPQFNVKCVVDGDWRHPVGELGPKPFCRAGIRCNQCEESKNTRECNRMFKAECKGECEAYGPIPF